AEGVVGADGHGAGGAGEDHGGGPGEGAVGGGQGSGGEGGAGGAEEVAPGEDVGQTAAPMGDGDNTKPTTRLGERLVRAGPVPARRGPCGRPPRGSAHPSRWMRRGGRGGAVPRPS